MMYVKKVEQTDLPQLSALYTQLFGAEGDPRKMRGIFAVTQNDASYVVLGVYEDDGNGEKLIATATLSRCLDLSGDARYYYNMENFVVDQAHRRRGVGRFLIEHIEQYVQTMGGSYLNFTSSTERKEAHAFYAAVGYPSDVVFGFKKRFPTKESME